MQERAGPCAPAGWGRRRRRGALLLVVAIIAFAAPADGRRRRLKRVANTQVSGQWCVFSSTRPGSLFEASFIAPAAGSVTIKFEGAGCFLDEGGFLDNVMVVKDSVLEDGALSFNQGSSCYGGCDCFNSLSPLCDAFCGANNEAPRVPAFSVTPSGAVEIGGQPPDSSLFPLVRVFAPGEGTSDVLGAFADILDPTECASCFSSFSCPCATESVILHDSQSVNAEPFNPARTGAVRLQPPACSTFGQPHEIITFPVGGLQAGELYTVLGWWNISTDDGLFVDIDPGPSLQPQATLSVTTPGAGSGHVGDGSGIDCGPTCSASYLLNSDVTLTAQADPGSRLVGWTGPCEGTPGAFLAADICELSLVEDVAVGAIFEPDAAFSQFDASECAKVLTQEAAECGPAALTALRLTPSGAGPGGNGFRGGAWLTDKVAVSGGFETSFEFDTFSPFGGEAGGFALVIQNQNEADPSSGLGGFEEGLGYAATGAHSGISRSLAIEFDHSQSSGGSDAPNAPHISIQTDGLNQNRWEGTHSLASISAPWFDFANGEVRIRYLPGVLEIYLGGVRAPYLTKSVDLEALDLLDADGKAWVGLTAASGVAQTEQWIESWSVTELTPSLHEPFAASLSPGEPHHDRRRAGEWSYFRVDVQPETLSLSVDLTNLTFAADLYLAHERTPDLGDNDCAQTAAGLSDERCTRLAPAAGTWWIGVRNGSGFTVTANPGPPALPSGPILLVDNDDNSPNMRPLYTSVLDQLGLSYGVWDTSAMASDPDTETLSQYPAVLWFSGDATGGLAAPVAGPGPAGEASLAEYLDTGGCFLISSQDYLWDRGAPDNNTPTPFMVNYLGVGLVESDVLQTSVTGANTFSGLGPYGLVGAPNFTDRLSPNASARTAFVGDQGNAAVAKTGGTYRTAYLGFPLDYLPDPEARLDVLARAFGFCTPTTLCSLPFHLALSQTVVVANQLFEACSSIWAGDGFVVEGTATLSAPTQVALGNGASVADGGTLIIKNE